MARVVITQAMQDTVKAQDESRAAVSDAMSRARAIQPRHDIRAMLQGEATNVRGHGALPMPWTEEFKALARANVRELPKAKGTVVDEPRKLSKRQRARIIRQVERAHVGRGWVDGTPYVRQPRGMVSMDSMLAGESGWGIIA